MDRLDGCDRETAARRWAGPLALAALAAAMPQGAAAQTASQVTPPTYAPPTVRPAEPIVLPDGSGVTAPPGAETLEVRLGGIAVEGEDDPQTAAALRAQLVGHPIKVAEIFAAARAMEARAARAGHMLTRVLVPAQELRDGATLRLVVVQGVIERVDTDGVPPLVRRRVAAVLAPLVGRADVTLPMVERRLLLAGDTPGVTLHSALAAGEKRGGTVLVIEARHRVVTGFATVDNTLPSSLGRSAIGLGLDVNSALGLGETLYLRASGFPNGGRETSILDPTPRNRALAGGVILPIGNDGLTLNLEAVDARTAPRHRGFLLGTGSRFNRVSARIAWPFVRTRALTVSGGLSFDAQRERVSVIDPLPLPLSLDDLRILRVDGSLIAATPGSGRLAARGEVSVGIDGLGARSRADATALLPLSRQGADASFQKLAVEATLVQPVGAGVQIMLAARAQTAFGKPLVNAEQIGIAAADGLSSLPSSRLQGDAGYVVRAEIARPFALAGARFSIAPYLFGAAGGVRYERPTALERRETGASDFGAGLRLAGAAQDGSPGVTVGLEWGRAHIEGAGSSDRFNFTIVTHF